MKKIILSGLILLASSSFAFAQENLALVSPSYSGINSSNTNTNTGQVRDLRSLISFVEGYINIAIELIVAIAVVVFVYNTVVYFVVKTEGDRSEAGKYLMFSVIGLAAVLSFWGLVNVVTKTFGLENNKPAVQNLYFK